MNTMNPMAIAMMVCERTSRFAKSVIPKTRQKRQSRKLPETSQRIILTRCEFRFSVMAAKKIMAGAGKSARQMCSISLIIAGLRVTRNMMCVPV